MKKAKKRHNFQYRKLSVLYMDYPSILSYHNLHSPTRSSENLVVNGLNAMLHIHTAAFSRPTDDGFHARIEPGSVKHQN